MYRVLKRTQSKATVNIMCPVIPARMQQTAGPHIRAVHSPDKSWAFVSTAHTHAGTFHETIKYECMRSTPRTPGSSSST